MSVMSYSPPRSGNTTGVVALATAVLGSLATAATLVTPSALYVGLALLVASLVLSIIGLSRGNAPKLTSVLALVLTLVMGVAGTVYFVLTPTKAQAGHQYLAILCPTNGAAEAFTRALDTQNLKSIKDAARDLSAAERTAATRLTDSSMRWPSAVDRKDLTTMADYYYRHLAWLNGVVSAKTYAELPGFPPRGDNFGEASQRIRAALDLPTDTTAGCAGLGDA